MRHDESTARIIPAVAGLSRAHVLLGSLRVEGRSPNQAFDLDDLLGAEERSEITRVAWRVARSWYAGKPEPLRAVAWLAEYHVGQSLLGVLRIVAALRAFETAWGPQHWDISALATDVLIGAVMAGKFEISARKPRVPASPLGRHRTALLRGTLRDMAASFLQYRGTGRVEWLGLGGGGVNQLLLAAGARTLRWRFLRDALPSAATLGRLAWRYQLIESLKAAGVVAEELDSVLNAASGTSDNPASPSRGWLTDAAVAVAPSALYAARLALLRAVRYVPAICGWAESSGRGVLTPDDAVPLSRAAVAVAGLCGIPAVVVQHGAVVAREDANHTVAGHSLTWGPAFAEVLRSEMGPERHRAWVMGYPAPPRPRGSRGSRFRNGRKRVLFLCTGDHALNLVGEPRHEQLVLRDVMQRLSVSEVPVDVVVRPHHSGAPLLALPVGAPNVKIHVGREGSMEKALRSAAVVVTTVSTGIVEAVAAERQVVACPSSMTPLVEGLRTLPGVLWATSPAQAADLLMDFLAGRDFPTQTVDGPLYVTAFVGWRRLAEHLATLEPHLTEPAAAQHARVLVELATLQDA